MMSQLLEKAREFEQKEINKTYGALPQTPESFEKDSSKLYKNHFLK